MLFAASSVTTTTEQQTPNFLLPNGTFIVELLIFLLVLGTIAKFVLPPLRRATVEREQRLVAQLDQSDADSTEATRLETERQSVLREARAEARSIVEEASRTVDGLLEEARARGNAEYERRIDDARPRLEAERRELLEGLVAHLDELVGEGADRVLGDQVDRSRHEQVVGELAAQLTADAEA